MSIASSLYTLLSLNTGGSANSGNPQDVSNASTSVGTNFSGPFQLTLTSSPVTIPGLASSSSVSVILIRNTGANPLILDMKNNAAASSQIGIAAGGQFLMFGTTTSNATSQSLLSSWTLSSSLGTTVLVAWVA